MPTNDDPASPEKSEETAETLDILGDPVLTAKIRAGMDDIAAERVEVLGRDELLRSLKGRRRPAPRASGAPVRGQQPDRGP